jgi:SAM-dependent methyltransferase
MPHDTTLDHLRAHHGDFELFRDLMVKSSDGRFGPVFWGVFDQYVRPRLGERASVVDVGCGPGGLFAPLRARVPHGDVVGLEIQPAMLNTAHARAAELGGVRVVAADVSAPLPLSDGAHDAAVVSMVLHEMPYPLALLRELHRVIRPGGALLVFDWVRQPLASYAAGAELTPDLIQHFREHCLYAPGDLAFLAESCGFEVLEVIGRRGGNHAMLALART